MERPPLVPAPFTSRRAACTSTARATQAGLGYPHHAGARMRVRRALKNSFKRRPVRISPRWHAGSAKSGRAVTLIWKKQRSWKIAPRETRYTFARCISSPRPAVCAVHCQQIMQGKNFITKPGYLTRYRRAFVLFPAAWPIDFPFARSYKGPSTPRRLFAFGQLHDYSYLCLAASINNIDPCNSFTEISVGLRLAATGSTINAKQD